MVCVCLASCATGAGPLIIPAGMLATGLAASSSHANHANTRRVGHGEV